ncbi:short-chain dehydrogenase/reductase [Corynebacterium sp. HMSC22B11]|nr:short-chain dehydrogenase/reductase [Corynebacterium sp. HMSC22B11]
MPQVPDGSLAVVTGASSGIGKAVAARFVASGFRVVGTTRNPATLTDPVPNVEYLALDLADQASIETFAEDVLALGAPGVLVNNAGESQNGPLEELPREALERLFQVNVIGHVDLTQKFLPAMREQGFGRIVMIGSMLGSFPLSYRGSYVASKAAIRSLADSARSELSPFGVSISTVEPGAIATGLSSRRTIYVDDTGPYSRDFHRMLDTLNDNEAKGISAEDVAELVDTVVAEARPRAVYAQGSLAPVPYILQRLVPRETMLRIMRAKHGL